MGQVQNGVQYVRHRGARTKTTAKEAIRVYTGSSSLAMHKSVARVRLAIAEVEKTNHENIDFVPLLSSFFFFLLLSRQRITRKPQGLYDHTAYQNDSLRHGKLLFIVGIASEPTRTSYSSKTAFPVALQ